MLKIIKGVISQWFGKDSDTTVVKGVLWNWHETATTTSSSTTTTSPFYSVTLLHLFIESIKKTIFIALRDHDMHKTDKYPIEAYYIGVDFTNRLSDGETILSSGSSVIVRKAGDPQALNILLDGSHFVVGNILKQKVSGGLLSDLKYYMHFRAVTSEQNTYNSVVEVSMV